MPSRWRGGRAQSPELSSYPRTRKPGIAGSVCLNCDTISGMAASRHSLRIKGVVRFERALRKQMALGFTPQERREWQSRTEQVLHQVMEICAAHHVKIEDLPAPTRRACRFLAGISWDTLPERTPPVVGSVAPNDSAPRKTIRLRNVVARCNVLHRRMQALAEGASDAPSRQALLDAIQRTADEIETLTRQRDGSPADLPTPTRRAYAWLRYLCEEEHLHAHLHTLKRVLRLWQNTASGAKHPLLVDIFFIQVFYRARPREGNMHLVLSEGLVGAPDDVLREIILKVQGKRSAHKRLHACAQTPAWQNVMRTLTALSDAGTQGNVYDLDALFDALNARYFDGALPKPHLTWNQRITRRKFGHYAPATDTIMLSSTLDSPDVPRSVVEFVLYHEMLHKALGVRIANGRRYAHTAEFRRRERLFEQYAEAQAVLQSLSLTED